jgi:hypothetical protein
MAHAAAARPHAPFEVGPLAVSHRARQHEHLGTRALAGPIGEGVDQRPQVLARVRAADVQHEGLADPEPPRHVPRLRGREPRRGGLVDDVHALGRDAQVGHEVAATRLGHRHDPVRPPHRRVQEPVHDPGPQLAGMHQRNDVVHRHDRRRARHERQPVHGKGAEHVGAAAAQGEGQQQLIREVGEPLGHAGTRQPDDARAGGIARGRRELASVAPALAQHHELPAALGRHRRQLRHEARSEASDAAATQGPDVDGAGVDDDAEAHRRAAGVSSGARRARASSVSRSSGAPPAPRTEIRSNPKASSAPPSEPAV